jgi:hypothetical protein
MTQDELNKAAAGGKVTEDKPESGPSDTSTGGTAPDAAPVHAALPDLSEYIPILVPLQSVQKPLSAHPTFVPQSFQEQIQFVFDGLNHWIDIYENGDWRKTMLDGAGFPVSPARGDVLYYNGSVWNRLPAGNSGYYLKTQGAGADPIFDSLNVQLSDFILTPLTAVDTVQTQTLNFRPRFILGMLTGTAGDRPVVWGWAVYNGEGNPTLTNNLAAPIPNVPAPTNNSFLGMDAATYVTGISVTGTSITFHWQSQTSTVFTAHFICLG